jgi:hypothetical protein
MKKLLKLAGIITLIITALSLIGRITGKFGRKSKGKIDYYTYNSDTYKRVYYYLRFGK